MFSPGRLILPFALLSLLGASCLENNKDPVIEIFKRSLAEKSNSEIINNPSVEEGTVQHVSEFIKERARRDSSSRVRRSGLFDDENVEWSINGQKINFTKPRSTTPTPSIFDDNDFSSHHGFNNNGFSSQGFGTPGFGSQGFGSHGFGSQGYNPQGYNPQGYNPQGYNPQGYNPQGYNPQGYNQQGYNPQRYDSQGHLINGQYPYNFNNQGGYLYPTTTKKPDPFKDFNDRVDNMNRKYTTGDLDVSKYMPNMNDFKF